MTLCFAMRSHRLNSSLFQTFHVKSTLLIHQMKTKLWKLPELKPMHCSLCKTWKMRATVIDCTPGLEDGLLETRHLIISSLARPGSSVFTPVAFGLGYFNVNKLGTKRLNQASETT